MLESESSQESSLVTNSEAHVEAAPSEAEPTKKRKLRSPLSSSLLIQIANQCGVQAAITACDANDKDVVRSALKHLAKKDLLLAETLGFVEEEKQRVSNVGKVNRANAAIVNVAHLGLKCGDSVSIDRSQPDVIVLRKL